MQDPFAPARPGFVEVESAVEGIRVFAPQKETVQADAPRTYTCPHCGASTHFDVAAGGVVCEHCGFQAGTRAEQVGYAAKHNEFSLDELKEAEQGWGVERRTLHCDACGAEMAPPEGALTATCPCCASNRVNLRTTSSELMRPRVLNPFRVQPDSNRQRARSWLGEGWFHPPELASQSVVERFTGIYLSFWTFSSRISSRWDAEVGRPHTVRRRDGSTHTEIRWSWKTGSLTQDLRDRLMSGSSHVSRRILERIYPFDLNELTAYSPDFLAGWNAQAYDISLPDAWEECKESMREEARQACRASIGEPHVRNFRMSADFADESWRYVLLPVYLTSYRFQGKVYQVLVNGQSGAIAGQKPVAWEKVWLAIAAMLAPGLLLGLVGLPLVLLGGVGVLPLGLGFLLLVIGGVGAFFLYRKARESEAP